MVRLCMNAPAILGDFGIFSQVAMTRFMFQESGVVTFNSTAGVLQFSQNLRIFSGVPRFIWILSRRWRSGLFRTATANPLGDFATKLDVAHPAERNSEYEATF